MKPKVYIETSIPSYLTAWRSRDLIMAANQEMTKEWWDNREEFDLYISALVIREAGAGDPGAAKKRLDQLDDIPELDITEDAECLAEDLLRKSRFLRKPGSMPCISLSRH